MTNQRASMKAAKNLLIFLCAAKLLFLGCAFVPARSQLRLRQINPPHSPLFSDASPAAFSPYPGTCEEEISNDGGAVEAATIGRRGGLSRCAFLTAAASVLTTTAVPFLVRAEEGGTATAAVSAQEAVVTANTVEMKTFVDPVGYFSVRVPKIYYAIRRSAKGDLPNASTGQGRRGASIFAAGDMAKAEVVAVERFILEQSFLFSGFL
mmetsp:Transcript_35897/g.83735  ORF Transcript_35897/g.83735 Transcript_35897/m.83735 type:complete len:208 (-) Transcript_35897:8-631(-)